MVICGDNSNKCIQITKLRDSSCSNNNIANVFCVLFCTLEQRKHNFVSENYPCQPGFN